MSMSVTWTIWTYEKAVEGDGQVLSVARSATSFFLLALHSTRSNSPSIMTDPPIIFGMKTYKKCNVHHHAKVQLSLAALVGCLQGMEGTVFETLQSWNWSSHAGTLGGNCAHCQGSSSFLPLCAWLSVFCLRPAHVSKSDVSLQVDTGRLLSRVSLGLTSFLQYLDTASMTIWEYHK